MHTNDELYHHGVLGMKWGVRRYQNKDGSLTSAGRKRIMYTDKEFYEAEQNVRRNLSNKYSNFIKKEINILDVKNRAAINDVDAILCSAFASNKFKEASKVEPRITNDVVDAVSRSGGKMYGLENRLKQPTSIAGKIGSDSKEKHISLLEASKKIKDVIRYTAILDDKNFVNNYYSIKKSLNEKGYTETRCRNYFDMYNRGEAMHKAVQCTYKDRNGYEFELQFQTPSSQAAKELKIPIYEERRKVGISEKRAKELETKMINLAEQVQIPPNIYRIKNK